MKKDEKAGVALIHEIEAAQESAINARRNSIPLKITFKKKDP